METDGSRPMEKAMVGTHLLEEEAKKEKEKEKVHGLGSVTAAQDKACYQYLKMFVARGRPPANV